MQILAQELPWFRLLAAGNTTPSEIPLPLLFLWFFKRLLLPTVGSASEDGCTRESAVAGRMNLGSAQRGHANGLTEKLIFFGR